MTDEELVGQLMRGMARMEKEISGMRATIGEQQNTIATLSSQITALNSTNQHLADRVMKLSAIVERLPCNPANAEHDTNPTCLDDGAVRSTRAMLRSVSDDEPDSVVTRQMDLRASRSGIEVKGPSIMVVALGIVIAIGAAAVVWFKGKLGL